jgi:cytochrome c biogenesis protein CcmG, thiol:disulfide interchange protein DsbE
MAGLDHRECVPRNAFWEARRADDGSRTRDLELGKLALYQLSYVRAAPILSAGERPISSLPGVSARAFAAFLAVLAVIGLLAFGLLNKSDPTIKVGEELPSNDLPVLATSETQTGSVDDYRGKWVLVNFWASWCAPCRDEAPALEQFHRHHSANDFTILGVDSEDNSDDALDFADEYGLTYPSLHDGSGGYHDDLGMTGYPESVLVDPDGNVALYQPGPFTEKTLDEQVAPLIEGKGSNS